MSIKRDISIIRKYPNMHLRRNPSERFIKICNFFGFRVEKTKYDFEVKCPPCVSYELVGNHTVIRYLKYLNYLKYKCIEMLKRITNEAKRKADKTKSNKADSNKTKTGKDNKVS